MVLIGLVICIWLGLYGQSEGGHGNEDDQNKDAGYMDDALVEDVPLNKELEQVLEMSNEDYETSRGSIYELRPLGMRPSISKDDPYLQRKPSRYYADRKMSKYKPSF